METNDVQITELLRRVKSFEKQQNKLCSKIDDIKEQQLGISSYQRELNESVNRHSDYINDNTEKIRKIEDCALYKDQSCKYYHKLMDQIGRDFSSKRAVNKFVNRIIIKISIIMGILFSLFGILAYIGINII